MKVHRIEYSLVEMLLGVGLFELTGKCALNFEQNGLGQSPLYLILITLGGLAMFMFFHGSIKLWKSATVKKDLNTFTKQLRVYDRLGLGKENNHWPNK